MVSGYSVLRDQKCSRGSNAAFFASSCHSALMSSSDVLRHHGLQLHEQVTALTGLVHQAMALGAHALAVLAAGRDLEVDLAGQGRHGDFSAQRQLPRCQWQGDDQVLAFDVEFRVRRKTDGQVQVAIGPATDARSALALEANALAVGSRRPESSRSGFCWCCSHAGRPRCTAAPGR